MTFADIPSGAAVFMDANSIIYHFISDPAYGTGSTKLLERLEFNDIEVSVGLLSSNRKSLELAAAMLKTEIGYS